MIVKNLLPTIVTLICDADESALNPNWRRNFTIEECIFMASDEWDVETE